MRQWVEANSGSDMPLRAGEPGARKHTIRFEKEPLERKQQ